MEYNQQAENNKKWQGWKKLEHWNTAGRNALLPTACQVLKKVNKNYNMIQQLFSLALHPREMKVNVHTKTCEINVHRTFIHNSQKSQRSSSSSKWINKMWYVCMCIEYSATKRNEASIFVPILKTKTSCSMKEARHKRTYVTIFY